MYKILIKCIKTASGVFWSKHTVMKDGKSVDFSTNNVTELRQEVAKLDKEYGEDNVEVFSEIDTDYFVRQIRF